MRWGVMGRGGELDPHGADGNGNPIGGLVFGDSFGNGEDLQYHEWTSFISDSEFCFRACVRSFPSSSSSLFLPILKAYIHTIFSPSSFLWLMGWLWLMGGIWDIGRTECSEELSTYLRSYGLLLEHAYVLLPSLFMMIPSFRYFTTHYILNL